MPSGQDLTRSFLKAMAVPAEPEALRSWEPIPLAAKAKREARQEKGGRRIVT
jgi:hypothetical protein